MVLFLLRLFRCQKIAKLMADRYPVFKPFQSCSELSFSLFDSEQDKEDNLIDQEDLF